MIIPINNLSEYGIIADRLPHELPPNAFSGGQNIRFRDGYAERFLGQEAAFGTPTVVPYWLLPVPQPADYYWVYAGLTKVYAVSTTSTHTNITRETTPGSGTDVNYSATADKNWTGGVLGGIPVLNNGIDPPQVWLPVSTSQRLLPLDYVTGTSTWASLSYTCNALRPFKDYLIALDCTLDSGVRWPHMVKWSHPAIAGALPVSWDDTDSTKDAGEYNLSQTAGYCLDCAPLRDINVIYKEDSIWGMQYIGGLYIFRFFQIAGQIGAIAKRCMTEFATGQHAVFGTGDCVVHDGQTMTSILSSRMRKWLYNQLDPTYYARNFIARVYAKREVWFCFTPTGSTFPTQALVWNFEQNSIGVRDLPGLGHLTEGQIYATSISDTWDGGPSTTWDADSVTWGESGYTLTEPNPLGAGVTDTLLYNMSSGLTFNGTDYDAYVERTGLGIPPVNSGTPPDISSMKFVRRVWPRIEGTDGATVQVEIGTQNYVDGSVTWADPINYTIGSNARIDCRLRGRMLAYRVSSSTDIDWRLHGIEFDVDKSGNF